MPANMLARILALTISASVLTLAGCGGGSPSTASKSGNASPFADPMAQSRLRETAIARLIKAANDGTSQERAHALESLIEAPSRLATVIDRSLTDQNLGVRAVGAMAAGEAGLQSARPMLRLLLNDPSERVRASAIYGLRKLGEPTDPTPLAEMLGSDSPRVRAHAAMILGKLDDRSALPMLREAAAASMPRANRSQVRVMQIEIAEALVRLGDDRALDEIRAALYPSRPEELEATALAVVTIGQVMDRASTDQLVYLTARVDKSGRPMPPEVRLAAAASLAQLGLPRGSFIAEEYLQDKNATLRAHAAYVFGEIGEVESLASLEASLEDSDPIVQISAAGAIVRVVDHSTAALTAQGGDGY